MSPDRFSQTQYVIRRKVFRFLGGAFHIYDASGNLLFYSDMKRLKLKEDIRIYTSDSKTEEVLNIQARTVLDISTKYDVFESKYEQRIGTIQRRGLRSMLRDEWVIMDPMEQPVATLREDSMLMAMLRRFLSDLIPQRYEARQGTTEGGAVIATYIQHFNPFIFRITADLSADTAKTLDPRLALAMAVLLTAIEGRQ